MRKESVMDIIEKVVEKMCDDYCKWPEIYGSRENADKFDQLLKEKCESCPLDRLM